MKEHGAMRDSRWAAAAGRLGPTSAADDIDKLSRDLDATFLSLSAHAPSHQSNQSSTWTRTTSSSSSRNMLRSLDNGNVRKEGAAMSTNANAVHLPKKSSKKSGTTMKNDTGAYGTSSTEKSSQAWPLDRLKRISDALPVGWRMSMSQSQGRPYYICQSTGVKTLACPIALDSMNEPIVTQPIVLKPAIMCVGYGRICNEKITGKISSTYASESNGQGYQCSQCEDPAVFCHDCAFEWGSFCAGMMCNKFYCDSCTPDYLGDEGGDQYCGRTCRGKHHPDYRKYSRHRVVCNGDAEVDNNDKNEITHGYRQCKGITQKGFRCKIKSYHDLDVASSLKRGDEFCMHHGGKVSNNLGSDSYDCCDY
mmetsp:Transcript_13374/g.32460  ORF Transcript_13374/g.32460 Transcript_13374/m.32460 type:complete len:364 (+) Transcript_13374:130-1221(+)